MAIWNYLNLNLNHSSVMIYHDRFKMFESNRFVGQDILPRNESGILLSDPRETFLRHGCLFFLAGNQFSEILSEL